VKPERPRRCPFLKAEVPSRSQNPAGFENACFVFFFGKKGNLLTQFPDFSIFSSISLVYLEVFKNFFAEKTMKAAIMDIPAAKAASEFVG
jgi:hypothetical protein